MDNCLFKFECSSQLANALGAYPMKLSTKHNHIKNFTVYEAPTTYYAECITELGRFVWLMQVDKHGILKLNG